MGVRITFLREPGEQMPATAQPVALVPNVAVRTADGQSFVFVVAGQTAERRAVRTGGVDGDRLEIVGGLRAGERVVLSPPDTLADGDRVQVAGA